MEYEPAIMTAASESTPLVSTSSSSTNGDAPLLSSPFSSAMERLFIALQVLFLAFLVFGARFSDDDYSVAEYVAFRDIMAMLLLGFGYLMTFLKSYGTSTV